MQKRRKSKLHVTSEKFVDVHMKKAERDARKKKRHPAHKARYRFVFWSSIVVVVCANLLVSLILVPFLTILNTVFFDFISLLVAFIVGLLYAFLLLDVAHLEKSHTFLAGFFVPVISIANGIFLWFVVAGYIELSGGIITRQNPWMISVLYGVVFAVPYVGDLLKTKRR